MIKTLVIEKAFEVFAQKPIHIESFPPSGSQRQYFRLHFDSSIAGDKTIIATYNENLKENQLFLAYTQHLQQYKIAVPKVYISSNNYIYFQEDLGNTTLLMHIETFDKEQYNQLLFPYYQKALSDLAYMQTVAGKNLDFALSSAHPTFDKMAMNWDLNYFKYWFLLPARIQYDEYALEKDFQYFLSNFDDKGNDYFLFRDFQARNIMVKTNAELPFPKLYYIDYQGAKKGPLHYDVASLLYQAKANLAQETRDLLFDEYVKSVQAYIDIPDMEKFYKSYDYAVLLRLLQVLGSYGFRGFYEQKPHFLSSIPYAVQNIKNMIAQKPKIFDKMPQLRQILLKIIEQYSI